MPYNIYTAPEVKGQRYPWQTFLLITMIYIVFLFPGSGVGLKVLVQYLVCAKHIGSVARDALEHHWYPNAT
jgi:hypothetical protein